MQKDEERNPEDLTIEDEIELKKRKKRYEGMDSTALLEETKRYMKEFSSYEKEKASDAVDQEEKDVKVEEEAEKWIDDELGGWDTVD